MEASGECTVGALLNRGQCVDVMSERQHRLPLIVQGMGMGMSSLRKLVFYSDTETVTNRWVDERLLRLIGCAKPRIGYVSASPDPERIYFDAQRRRYQSMGAECVVYVDEEVVHDAALVARLLTCDAIHLSGGNTFAFLHWLKRSPLIQQLPGYAAQGGVLIGVSAGAMLMTPGIACAELCGDSRNGLTPDDGALGLVDFHFWPHYPRDQVMSPTLAKRAREFPGLLCCSDGGGVVVDGERVERYGPVGFYGTE